MAQDSYEFYEQREPRSVDSLPVRAASMADLDIERVQTHITSALERGRFPDESPRDVTGYLAWRGCTVKVGDTLHPTVAGLLCFGRNPQQFIRPAVVDIGHYRGVDAISDELFHLEKGISGTIFDQLTRMEEYLWRNTHHGMRTADDSFQRVELHEYPRAVMRELCVNSLAHRDYSLQGTTVRVMLFRNRTEWYTPGGLPPGVTVGSILTQHVARNPVIVKVLYEAGYVEEFGQGVRTVVKVLEREGMTAPEFLDVGAAFIVTVFGRKPDAFANASLYAHLPDSQQRIMNYIRERVEVSPRDLFDTMGGDRARRSIQRDLDALVEGQLLTAIGSTKARRYRLAARTP